MSRQPDRSPAAGRKSWKQHGTSAAIGAQRKSSKSLGRWFLTFVLLALLAGFIYWVMPDWRGQRHLIVTSIWATDRLSVPPVAYAREDLDALLETPDVSVALDATGEGQDEAGFGDLAEKVAKRTRGANDLLMFYIAAHGLADENGAVLICSDFARSAKQGRYPIRTLLDKISSSPAGLKLIILDVGRLNYDPRLGIIGNDFAAQVIQDVQKHSDPNLWVLLASGPGQGVALQHSDGQSVFGSAVAKALAGEATRSADDFGDQYVDLREFVQYVSRECRQWYGAELPDFQSPVLIQVGKGIVADEAIPNDKKHFLLYIAPVTAEPEPEAEEKPTEPAAEEKNKVVHAARVQPRIAREPRALLALFQAPAAPPTEKANTETDAPAKTADAAQPAPAKTDDAKNDKEKEAKKAEAKEPQAKEAAPPKVAEPPVAEKKSAPPKKEGPPPTPQQQVRIELQRLWELRDQLRDRQFANQMAPVDFAPHIWREAEAWLLYYEQRARAGRVVNSTAPGDAQDKQEIELRLRDMRQLADELTRVRDAMSGATASASRDQKSVGDRLLAAWQRYLRERKGADDKFDQEADELLRQARQASRRVSDQVYNAAYFVRWFGHTSITLADTSRYRNAIGGYLDDLHAATRELRDLERSPLKSSEQSRLRALINHEQQLGNRERELAGELAVFEKSALEKIENRVSQLRAEQLLTTSWLPAVRRLHLFDELVKKRTDSNTGEGSAASDSRTSDPSRLLSLRGECLQLEAKLIQLADADAARRVASAAQNAGPSEEADVQASRLRNGLREVVTFYSALPRSLTGDFSLHLVDARDAASVDADTFVFPTFDVELERSSELRLVPLAKQLQIQQGQPATLSVTVRASKRNLLDARVTPVNSEGLLTFELQNEEELPPERGWHSKTIHWRVIAKPAAISEKKGHTSIAVTATGANGVKDSTTIDVDLPQPNRVDVVFTRIGSSAPGVVLPGDVRLALFSNRRTKFQCALVNQHDRPKSVNVTLYAVVPRPNVSVPIGKFDQMMRRTIYDPDSRVLSNVTAIAKSEKPVELPAADPNNPEKARVLVNFINPNAPPPPAAPAAGAAPPPATPAPSPDPVHGLILEIVDAKDSSQVFPVKWIELEALAPRDFLNIDVGYDQRRQQILVQVRPKNVDAQGLPELPAGKPILVNWDASDAKLPPEGAKNLEGEIDATSPKPMASLAAQADADGQERIVKIGVDGYPRAFWYKVVCRQDSTQDDVIPIKDDLERETTSIKIESVSVPAQNKVYHFLRDFQIPPPTDEKAPKIDHVFLSKGQSALFRAPAETIIVNLQADAPLDAFRAETDRIQVTLRERNSLQVISRMVRTDRDFRAFYVGCGARGVLELESQISDLAIALPAGRLENVDPVIDADIRFGANDDSDAVLLKLDGDTPRIEGISLPKLLPKDAQVPARILVTDYEGVNRVIYGFSKDGSPKLAEADAKTVADIEPKLDENRRFVVDFEIDLKDQPAIRRLLLMKVVDNVGHESPLVQRDIVITDVKAMPEKGEIRGVIRFGPAKVNGDRFKMTIEGGDLGPTPVPIQSDGSFVIPDLPIAEYTLKVLEGQFSGKSIEPKEQKGVKPVDPKKPQPITINVQG